MARGRRALPTETKRANGNPGKRPLNSKDKSTGEGLPDPKRLPPISMAMYREVRQLLREMQLEDKADRYAVELLARAYNDWRQAQEFVEKNGSSFQVTSREGAVIWRPYPQVRVAADAWRRVKSMLEELGLTPASRVKFGDGDDASELDRLFNQLDGN